MKTVKKYYDIYERESNYNIDFENLTVGFILKIEKKYDFIEFKKFLESKSLLYRFRKFFFTRYN